MVTVVLLSVSLLAADPPQDEPKPATAPAKVDEPKPAFETDEPKAEPSDEAKAAEALAQYNERKAKAKNTADAQWRLATWCEQHGLHAEALVHLANVVKLDPKRAAAWKKLGFKKVGNRWVSEEQLKVESEQREALRIWGPRLSKLHRMYHDPKTQAQAEEELGKLDDPKAIQALFRELGTGGPIDQTLAIQALGQIDDPLASKALAALAVYGRNAEVRRKATETLRGREPADFADALIAVMTEPLKYEVKPVGGPGSPGVLFVEGERYNTRRFYAPPPPPNLVYQPGDIVSYDQFGLPVLSRDTGYTVAAPPVSFGGSSGSVNVPPALAHALGPQATGALKSSAGNASGPFSGLSFTPSVVEQSSVTQNLIQAQRAAQSAQAQLQADVERIEAFNKVRKAFNDLVVAALEGATGEQVGDRSKDWKGWLAERRGYAADPPKTPKKPTLDQVVPLAYNPPFAQISVMYLPKPPDN